MGFTTKEAYKAWCNKRDVFSMLKIGKEYGLYSKTTRCCIVFGKKRYIRNFLTKLNKDQV